MEPHSLCLKEARKRADERREQDEKQPEQGVGAVVTLDVKVDYSPDGERDKSKGQNTERNVSGVG